MNAQLFPVSKLERIDLGISAHRGVFVGHWKHREEKANETGPKVLTIGRLLRTLRDTE
jgi:hypothetical protein